MQSGTSCQPGIKQVNWSIRETFSALIAGMNWKAAVTYFLSDHFTKRVWQTILITCLMKIVRQVWQTIMNAVRLILAASTKMKNLHSETRKKVKNSIQTGFSIVCGIFPFFFLFAVFFFFFTSSMFVLCWQFLLLYFSIQLNETTNSLKKRKSW